MNSRTIPLQTREHPFQAISLGRTCELRSNASGESEAVLEFTGTLTRVRDVILKGGLLRSSLTSSLMTCSRPRGADAIFNSRVTMSDVVIARSGINEAVCRPQRAEGTSCSPMAVDDMEFVDPRRPAIVLPHNSSATGSPAFRRILIDIYCVFACPKKAIMTAARRHGPGIWRCPARDEAHSRSERTPERSGMAKGMQ